MSHLFIPSRPPLLLIMKSTDKLYGRAFWLAIITVAYNLIEGAVSTIYGFEDESLTLLGFGIDSFIEVISGIGIIHMVRRITANPLSSKDRFEKTALKITGSSFYFLAVGLMAMAIKNIIAGQQPESTFWGLVVSSLSILTMFFLYRAKLSTGRALDSQPIIADAKCTRVCIYMSVILLLSSVLHEAFGVIYIDSAGAIGLAYYSLKEGKESFDKAKGKECDDCC